MTTYQIVLSDDMPANVEAHFRERLKSALASMRRNTYIESATVGGDIEATPLDGVSLV